MSAEHATAGPGLEPFSPAAKRWFGATFGAPTPVQQRGWARIAAGEHALLTAPTGSGKTLAAFFWCLDQLARKPVPDAGVRVLYVSPLKALVYDIERNLRAPLAGLAREVNTGLEGDTERWQPRVAVRTGDTSQKERRLQARDPADILVTTPESLYLLLGSKQRENLRSVEWIIVDEIHALAASKRGAHLALSLERLAEICPRDPQRIGLSATAEPVSEVARFLGGSRPVAIVDESAPPRLVLEIAVPVPDMTRPADAGDGPAVEVEPAQSATSRDAVEAQTSVWPAIYPELLAEIRKHRSTIVFTNSRGLCERMSHRINELAGEPLVRAHHGSVAHDKRSEIEEALKAGEIRGIVATSSLELGIDMGAVDRVLLVESPGAVSRGLQRVGRAGHSVGETSRGRLFPKHRADLVEATVVASGMREGAVEPLRLPTNPLDVLAQQIVAMCGERPWSVETLARCVRRTASFAELPDDALTGVLDMLSGKYPSTDFNELRPRIVWERESDTLHARPGANRIAIMSGGTIPDRGLYAVQLGEGGPRVGELDEEMVHESRPGDAITLGASTWRITAITRDRVFVQPAPGEPGRLPFWRGEGPGRPIELGRALGAFVRKIGGMEPVDARRELEEHYDLDRWAAKNLVSYLDEQREATGTLPTDRAITIERFRDELGDWRICVLSPFGARLHAPWALAIESRLGGELGHELQTLWNDDGIVLRFADAERLPPTSALVPDPDELEDLVVRQLASSALFASRFRENAARALLLPRRRPGTRTPLWVQRLRAQNLLAIAKAFPSFPIMLETYRECLQDHFDVPGLVALLREVQENRVRVDDVETRSASPFARSLVFAYTQQYLYQGDTPLAERRAQALTLDRQLLRELLGEEELRELLDSAVLADVEAELQGEAEKYRATSAEALVDRLRRVGDLSAAEIDLRCDGETAAWLGELEAAKRVLSLSIGGEQRWIAIEDAARYRDAFDVALGDGVPEALREPVAEPLVGVFARFARNHGPFTTRQLAIRYAVLPAAAEAVLEKLEADERLLRGEFIPGGEGDEWCEPDVLRRLRRRTLAVLRSEVAPVEGPTYARFLARWHRIGEGDGGRSRTEEVLAQLEGLPLPFSELERVILPARITNFEPRLLDELGALGQIVWIGHGSLGARDGRIALYRRDRVALLAESRPEDFTPSPLAARIVSLLGERGACFGGEIAGACGRPSNRELMDALWELVWAGQLTNDTFAPLRALATRARAKSSRRTKPTSTVAGRWSLVDSLLVGDVTPTERAHARTTMLLDRYGVASRDALGYEDIAGGFSAVYPVLREMEDAGKLRRGHFVAGFSGAQFAFAGAVDILRDCRAQAGGAEAHVSVLAANDPANPYGAALPWPTAAFPDTRPPRRASGAFVVLVEGALAIFVDRGRALTFDLPDPAGLALAASALDQIFADRRRGPLRLRELDGLPARDAKRTPLFVEAGFRREYDALVLERFG